MNQNNRLLRMQEINKSFYGVPVLKDVSFDLSSGEIHALVGENGAGKSTLMKILSGTYTSDSGQIFINDEEVNIKSPSIALKYGIGIIYQEFRLAPQLSVAENIFLGNEPTKYGDILDWARIRKEAQSLLDDLHLNIDPRSRVEELTTAQRQLVEIVKIISRSPKILILDEPTSSLADSEVDILFDRLKILKTRGIGIIYISHRLNEIKSIADRVTVLRDGHYIDTLEKKDIDLNKVIQMMVGRTGLETYFRETEKIDNECILEVRNLSNEFVRNISFKLYKGEILGFAGLMGAGRSEAMRAVFGIDPIDEGEVIINNKKIEISHPKNAISKGVGFAPEDRKEQALFLEKNVGVNISIASLFKNKSGFRTIRKEKEIAKEFVASLNIRTPDIFQKVKRLSGGNQQKIVISRWLALEPNILILDEPTRGIDVGAKTEIYDILSEMVKKGVAVIVVSSEMPELLAIADRIIVMHEGEITGELEKEEATQEKNYGFSNSYRIREMKNKNIFPSMRTEFIQFITDHTIWIFLLLIVSVVSIYSNKFLNQSNVINILREAVIVGVVGVGMTFVIISGCFDLSAGAILGLSAVISLSMKPMDGWTTFLSIIIPIIFGFIFGLINGLLVGFLKMNAFITTLGMQYLILGITLLFTGGTHVYVYNSSPFFYSIGNGSILNIPISVVILIVLVVIAQLILSYTNFGQYVHVVGENQKAATLSGINSEKVKCLSYVILGICASIAGIILASWIRMLDPGQGIGYEFTAITATILGGANLAGGKGNIFNTFAGALLIIIIVNAMLLINISYNYQLMVRGIIMIMGVMLGLIYEKKR